MESTPSFAFHFGLVLILHVSRCTLVLLNFASKLSRTQTSKLSVSLGKGIGPCLIWILRGGGS